MLKIENGKFTLDVEIPKGATAKIFVANAKGDDFELHEVSGGKYHYER